MLVVAIINEQFSKPNVDSQYANFEIEPYYMLQLLQHVPYYPIYELILCFLPPMEGSSALIVFLLAMVFGLRTTHLHIDIMLTLTKGRPWALSGLFILPLTIILKLLYSF